VRVMRLYHHPMSSNARRVTLVCRELGLEPELVFVDLAKGAQRDSAFVALNPQGKVPVLIDGDLTLTESWAIMMHLASKAPSPLYPVEANARARVNQWMFWTANHVSPQVATLNFENMLKAMFNMGPPDPARVAHADKELTTLGGYVDGELATRPWLAGSEMTIADLALAASMMSLQPAKLPLGDFKHLMAWFARVRERDSWKATEPKFGP
jgi:glutathione S-transferase